MDDQASNALFDDDHNLSDESNEEKFEVQELDDAFAFKYFRKFEPDLNYDRNAPMPFDDGSIKAYYAIRRHCKDRGISHIRQDGTIQPPRQIREACKCRRLCYMKFLDDVRSKLLNNLLGLSAAGQILFLSNHIKCITVESRSAKQNTEKKKRLYYFPSYSGRIRVCVKVFMNTYDLSEQKLRIFNKKISAGTYDYLAKKATTQNSNKALQSIPNSIKQETSIDIKPKDVSESMNSMEFPQKRDLGDMEAYFLRYEISEHKARRLRLKFRTRSGRLSTNKEIAKNQIAKIKGYAFIRHDGSMAPARTLKPVCSCRLLCSQRITNDARQILLNNLLNLSAQGQENFLYKHAHVKNVTKQRNILHHILPTSTEPIRVCREMFLNTFDMHVTRMQYILEKKRREEKTMPNIENDEELSCKEDSVDTEFEEAAASCSIPKTEIDDDYHVDSSSELLQTKVKDGTDNNIDNNEKCISHLKLMKKSEENSTIVSNSNAKVMFDDVFLDQYFHRYNKNVDTEGQTYKRSRKCKYKDYGESFESCSCTTYGCASWLTKDLQQKIFTRFLRLSYLNQNRFLYRHIRKKDNRWGEKSESGRDFRLIYYIPTIKGYVKVCKVMFISTFKITGKKIRDIIKCEELAGPLEEKTIFGSQMETNDAGLEEFDSPNVACEHYSADYPENPTGTFVKLETNSEAEQSIANPLFSVQSYNYVSSSHKESDEKFIDKYFQQFNSNAGDNLMSMVTLHEIFSFPACTCFRNCNIRFSLEIRAMLFSRYTQLAVENKHHFLKMHVKKDVELCSMNENSTQSSKYIYYLPDRSGIERVCNIMFLGTFNIRETELREVDLVEERISSDTECNSPETMIEFSDIKIENHSDFEN